jgi:hypothetical protein
MRKVTFTKEDASEMTVNSGAKSILIESEFVKILDVLVKINPKLQIPNELKSTWLGN